MGTKHQHRDGRRHAKVRRQNARRRESHRRPQGAAREVRAVASQRKRRLGEELGETAKTYSSIKDISCLRNASKLLFSRPLKNGPTLIYLTHNLSKQSNLPATT